MVSERSSRHPKFRYGVDGFQQRGTTKRFDQIGRRAAQRRRLAQSRRVMGRDQDHR